MKFTTSQNLNLDQSSMIPSSKARPNCGEGLCATPVSGYRETAHQGIGSGPNRREQPQGGCHDVCRPPRWLFQRRTRSRPPLFAGEWNFVSAAGSIDSLPPMTGTEIAFAGRSNVGKSSLINALTGRKALARTSNTPGRTQELIFFGGPPGSCWSICRVTVTPRRPRARSRPGRADLRNTCAAAPSWRASIF